MKTYRMIADEVVRNNDFKCMFRMMKNNDWPVSADILEETLQTPRVFVKTLENVSDDVISQSGQHKRKHDKALGHILRRIAKCVKLNLRSKN